MIFIVEPWNEIYKKDQERYESFNQLIDMRTTEESNNVK